MMKKYIFFLLGVFLFLQQNISFADRDVLRFDLKKSIEYTLKNSEAYRIKEILTTKAQATKDAGVAMIRPHISAQASFENLVEYPQYLRPLQKDYDTSLGVEVSQVVFAFGRLTSAIKAAEEYMAVTMLEKQAAKQDLIFMTKTLFYGCLAAQETKKVLQQSLQHTIENKEILEDVFKFGRPSKADLLKISADIAERIPSVKTAETYENQQMIYFKTMLGVPLEETIELTGSLSIEQEQQFDKEMALDVLNQQHPSLKALSKNIELQQQLVTMKKAEHYPQINAFLNYNNTGTSDDFDMKRGSFEHYAILGLKVQVPIWNGGLTTAELKQARLDYDTARLYLAQTQKEMLSSLNVYIEQYHAYIDIVKSQKEAVLLAKESYEMVKNLFKTGQVSVSDLNDAELFWTSQRIALIKTLYEFRHVESQIENLIKYNEDEK